MLSEFSHHGIASRFGKKRADLVHQPIDPVIVVAPWVVAGALAYRAVKSLANALRR